MKSFCSFLLVLLLPAFLQAQFSDALLGEQPIRNSILGMFAEEKDSVQTAPAEEVIHVAAYSGLDTCKIPNILNIKVNQNHWYNAQLSYKGIKNQSLQWRCRKKGAADWWYPFVTTDSITNISIEPGGGEYEIQVRQNCPNLASASDYSKSLFVTFAACVFPDAKNVSFDTSFFEFPSLRISIFLRTNITPFSFKWYYRELGQSAWVDTIQNTNNSINILNLKPGQVYEVRVDALCGNDFVSYFKRIEVPPSCIFPDAKNVHFDTSFSAFPSLWISISLVQRFIPFSFKWYYRELGQSAWVDTIRSRSTTINILNLKPGQVYEVRVDAHCENNFVSYFKRIEVPPSCLIISKISIEEVHDSSVFVGLSLGQRRMIEYRYRIVGQPNYSFTKLRTGNYLKGLIPGTSYEISARVVCEDTLLAWSPSKFFTTKNCRLPLAGDISLLQFNTKDAATFSADYLNFNFPVKHDYIWRYKPANQNLWTTPTNGKQQQFTFSNLSGGQKYDLSVAITCPNSPQDSLRLETSFTAELSPCTEQPDTASVQITFQKGTLDPVIQFKSPKGYRYQMRTKPENGFFVRYFPAGFEDKFLTVFSLHPGMNDFQFRLICPNGNKSPWSAVIKLFNRKNPGTIKAPKIHSGLVDRLTDAPPSGTLRVIPNPSPGKIDIVFSELTTPLTGARLEVFNTSGQRVLTLKTSIEPTQTLPLDLSNQTPGLYILRIQSGQKVYTERIMIASNR